MTDRYQEPLEIFGPSMFGDDDRRDEVTEAFERFKLVCKAGDSTIESALHKNFDDLRPEFNGLWRRYHDGRRAEARAARSRVKPALKALGAKAADLGSDLANLDRDARRYLLHGLAWSAQGIATRDAAARIDRMVDDLEQLAATCRAESAIQHKPGDREDVVLRDACKAMQNIILSHANVRIPKSLELLKDGSFGSQKVEIFFQLMRSVDPTLKPSQIKTALQKLPTPQKSGNDASEAPNLK